MQVSASSYRRIASSALPILVEGSTRNFEAIAYRREAPEEEILVLRIAPSNPALTIPLVRIHSGCVTGDALGSLRCDCGFQLQNALKRISKEAHGLLIYMPNQEGRGIGLANKIRAYALQDQGYDTVDANTALGLSADSRTYDGAASALLDLGVRRVRLLTNNPRKMAALQHAGIDVIERVPATGGGNEHNQTYLATKVARMAHFSDETPPGDR